MTTTVLLIVLSAILALALILARPSVRVVREYERGVVFRLGRLKSTIVFPLPIDLIRPLLRAGRMHDDAGATPAADSQSEPQTTPLRAGNGARASR